MAHQRLDEITTFLAETRAELLATVAGLSQGQMEFQPPAGWSIAQVLQHVALVESSIGGFLGRRLQRAIDAGLTTDTTTTSVFGALDPASLERPMEAPEPVQPQPGATSAEAIPALAASRAKLLAFIETVGDWDGTQVTARHVALGTLNLYQWLLLVGYHDRRHAGQIERLRGS
jgi:DinB family protein